MLLQQISGLPDSQTGFKLAMALFLMATIVWAYVLYKTNHFREIAMLPKGSEGLGAAKIKFARQIIRVMLFFMIPAFCYNLLLQIWPSMAFLTLIVGALSLLYFFINEKYLFRIWHIAAFIFYPLIICVPIVIGPIYSNILALLAIFLVLGYMASQRTQHLINFAFLIGGVAHFYFFIDKTPDPVPEYLETFEILYGLTCLFLIVVSMIYIYNHSMRIQQEVFQKNAFLQQVFDINPYYLSVKDLDRRVTFINPAVEKVTGLSSEYLLGKRLDELYPDFYHNNGMVEDELTVLKEEKTIYRNLNYYSMRFKQDVSLEMIHKPIYNEKQKLSGILTVAVDMSEKYQQRLLIEKQVKDLHQKNEILEKYIESNLNLEKFAYVASHDLKAPIRTIISFAQLLAGTLNGQADEDQQAYLEFIISASHNMERLIDDLLAFSRVNSTKLKPGWVNLPEVIEGITLELSAQVNEKQANIQFQNLPEEIWADEIKIKQVFQNLIGNALKFSTPDKTPEIQISCVASEDQWQFRVQDNGIGIHPDFQEKIFMLFQRLHTQSEYEGTGIGLALCRKIAEQHGGKMSVESAPGKGAVFVFTIPRINVPEVKDPVLEQR